MTQQQVGPASRGARPTVGTLPLRIGSLAEISDRFDGALLDQWGVLHDGAKAPPGAIDAVGAMARADKRLAVLSNSARPGKDALGRLAALGYDPAWFAGVVTSGEVVQDMLRDRTDPFFDGLGSRVWLIARDGALIDRLDYVRADSPDRADFVLLGSATAPELSLAADHAAGLARAAERCLKLLCANPDRVGVAADGLIEGPGTLAAYYESLGGFVRYIGKPHPEVYARGRDLLQGLDPARIVAIGDSLEHDIAGGRAAGCLTAFVEQGIHLADLAAADGLAELCARFAVVPDFILPRLIW
jgi:HAD superfamily hydrolase (TIGR01459 family)